MIRVHSIKDEAQMLIEEAYEVMNERAKLGHGTIDYDRAFKAVVEAYRRETLIGITERLGHESVLAVEHLKQNVL